MHLRRLVLVSLCAGAATASPLAFQARRPAPRPAAAPSVGSTSEITIDNGSDFQAARFPLGFVNGDWYATGTDAYASLTLETKTPQPVRLDLQWNGAGQRQTINAGNNKDLGASQSFFLTMTGEGLYNLRSSFGAGDGVTITIGTITDHDLDATIDGRISANVKLRNPALTIKGTIHLHRDTVPPRITTGTDGDCDAVVHDKYVGAEARSPSGCEVKFDAEVRAAFARAFAGIPRAFPSTGWNVTMPAPSPIVRQARHTETKPYRMDFSSAGAYVVSIDMTPANPAFAEYQRLGQSVTDPDTMKGQSIEQLAATLTRIQNATKARVTATINYPIGSISTFSLARSPLDVPGAAFGFFAERVQAPTGGGADAAVPAAYIFAGSWTQPSIRKESDGGENIALTSAFKPGVPMLSVQTVQIRIAAGADLAKKIAAAIDLAPLTQLMHGQK
jgi:hypothetical protein